MCPSESSFLDLLITMSLTLCPCGCFCLWCSIDSSATLLQLAKTEPLEDWGVLETLPLDESSLGLFLMVFSRCSFFSGMPMSTWRHACIIAHLLPVQEIVGSLFPSCLPNFLVKFGVSSLFLSI